MKNKTKQTKLKGNERFSVDSLSGKRVYKQLIY